MQGKRGGGRALPLTATRKLNCKGAAPAGASDERGALLAARSLGVIAPAAR
jgi:hypothetical protein